MTYGQKIQKLAKDMVNEEGALAEFILTEALKAICGLPRDDKEWAMVIIERRDRNGMIERHAPSHYFQGRITAEQQKAIDSYEKGE